MATVKSGNDLRNAVLLGIYSNEDNGDLRIDTDKGSIFLRVSRPTFEFCDPEIVTSWRTYWEKDWIDVTANFPLIVRDDLKTKV